MGGVLMGRRLSALATMKWRQYYARVASVREILDPAYMVVVWLLGRHGHRMTVGGKIYVFFWINER